jgi:putative endonuclease
MGLWEKLRFWSAAPKPIHLVRGTIGEEAARRFLEEKGFKFLTANFASKRGEIDLIFRDGQTLVFVEVKTRSVGGWTRPARAVDRRKRQALVHTADDYLRLLKDSQVPYRFDVVEVLLADGQVTELRHLPNAFNRTMARPRRR